MAIRYVSPFDVVFEHETLYKASFKDTSEICITLCYTGKDQVRPNNKQPLPTLFCCVRDSSKQSGQGRCIPVAR